MPRELEDALDLAEIAATPAAIAARFILLLAARQGDNWVSVGSVGTGFKEQDAVYLKTTLDKLKTKTPVVPMKGRNLVFAQPTLIAEVQFRGWTDDGNLRHASYKGLREVQDDASIYQIT
jgi:bifunctional non-homologous end joining protein LigD